MADTLTTNPTTTSKALHRLRDLLTPANAWLQGGYARSLTKPVDPLDPTAVCWCLSGAVIRCCHEAGCSEHVVRRLLVGSIRETHPDLPRSFGTSLSMLNDDLQTSHGDVLRVIDWTIEWYELLLAADNI